MKLPVLKIDTINNKYSIDNIELETIKNVSISLEGGKPVGLVRIELLSDVVIEGELVQDIEFKKKLNGMNNINWSRELVGNNMNNKFLIKGVGGSKRFNNIVRDLKEVIERYNLQFTPTILRDLIEEILINR